MSVPGFTAEASIFKSNRHYRMKGAPNFTIKQLLNPAAFGGWFSPSLGDCLCYEWDLDCQWYCSGSNPQICRRHCYPVCVDERCE